MHLSFELRQAALDRYVDINLNVACSRRGPYRLRPLCWFATLASAFTRGARHGHWRVASTRSLRPLGLNNGQFSLMMSLNRPDHPTMGSVASLLAMDRTTLTAALKPLERDGLIKLIVDPQDRRSRRMELTPAGCAMLARAFPVWKRTHAEIDALPPNGD